MVDDYWESSKKMLADAEFLKSLREFDKDNIPAATIQKIKPYCLGSCPLMSLDCLIILGYISLLSLVLETSFYLERKNDLQDLTNISIVYVDEKIIGFKSRFLNPILHIFSHEQPNKSGLAPDQQNSNCYPLKKERYINVF